MAERTAYQRHFVNSGTAALGFGGMGGAVVAGLMIGMRRYGLGIATAIGSGIAVQTARNRMEGTGQQRAINTLVRRAKQERRSRSAAASAYQTVRGHYARGPNGTIAWVKQHTRRVG